MSNHDLLTIIAALLLGGLIGKMIGIAWGILVL